MLKILLLTVTLSLLIAPAHAQDNAAGIPITADNADQVVLLGAFLHPADDPYEQVRSLFSPDGRWLLSYSGTNSVIWNTADLKLDKYVEIENERNGSGYFPIFSPDSSKFVLMRTTLDLWALEPLASIASIPSSYGFRDSVRFSPNSSMLATYLDQGIVEVWNTSTGVKITQLEHPSSSPIAAMDFSPDSRLLASTNGFEVYLWNIATGELLATFATELESSSPERDALFFTPNGDTLIFRGRTHGLYIWDLGTLTERRYIEEARNALVTDDKLFAGYFESDGLHVIDLQAAQEQVSALDNDYAQRGFEISPTLSTILMDDFPDLRLIDIATGIEHQIVDGGRGAGVYESKFSPDGEILASFGTGRDCNLTLRDVQSGEVLTTQTSTCQDFAQFSPDGTLITSHTTYGKVLLIYGIPTAGRPAYASVPAEVLPSSINVRSAPDEDAEIVGTVSGWVTVGGVDPSGQYFYLTSHDAWALADPHYVNLREFSTIDQLRVLEVD